MARQKTLKGLCARTDTDTDAILTALGARLPKGAGRGTQRSVPPEATLARFGGLAPAMGLTRIGNVTGLDDIGIPAVVAVRPASLSVSVAMGKGLTLAHARASALMEAAETFHGERIEGRFHRASEHAMGRAGEGLVSPNALCRTRAPYDPRQAMDWIAGLELMRGRPCWVPACSVHTDCTRGGDDAVLTGSNGLASGNHLLEAVSAGLCELIERDAVALWHARGLLDRARHRLDLASVDDPACRALLDRFAAVGVRPRVWHVTSDLGVATFVCDLQPRAADHAPTLRRSRGAGCHPEPAVALARALTEAAQSRLHRICGLRNDLGPEAYTETASTAAGAALLDALSDAAPGQAFGDAPRFSSDDIGEDVRWLLGRLAACGLAQVVAVDLTRPALGIPVVRMVVPGLEWDGDHPAYRAGARARRVQAESCVPA